MGYLGMSSHTRGPDLEELAVQVQDGLAHFTLWGLRVNVQQGQVAEISGIAEVSWQEAKGGDSPGGPVVKNLPANAGNMGSIPGPGSFYMFQGS